MKSRTTGKDKACSLVCSCLDSVDSLIPSVIGCVGRLKLSEVTKVKCGHQEMGPDLVGMVSL